MILVNRPEVVDSIGFMNLTTQNVDLRGVPSAFCTSLLAPWLLSIFFVGALLIYVGECVLSKRGGTALLLMCAILFYGIVFAILA